MKLLTQVFSNAERARVEDLLNERGIPTYARGTGGSRTGTALGSDIFVCVDAQFEDAVTLLTDPDHQVSQPIDVAEFKQDVARVGVGPIAKWLVLPVLALVALFAATVYFLTRQGV